MDEDVDDKEVVRGELKLYDNFEEVSILDFSDK